MNDDDNDPRARARADQALAAALDSLPPAWFRLYTNCILAGFSEQQAMEMVKTFILSAGRH